MTFKHYRFFKRRWPFKKTRYLWLLMLVELIFMIPCLILHGIAHPDTWRSTLWEVGYVNHWNSDPRMLLYAAANYQPKPTVAFVWTRTLTLYNVAVTIVTLFTLLLRMVLFIMKVFFPIIAVVFHIGLVGIWTVSVYGQMGPDYADPRYPSKIAWYIVRSCDPAGGRFGAYKECQMAKASFALSVVMLAIMTVHLGIAIWGLWPSEQDKHPRRKRKDGSGYLSDSDEEGEDEEEERSSGGSSPTDPKAAARGDRGTWEMTSMSGANPKMPASPQVMVQPYTPRTLAFHHLDRKLPLRYS